MKKLLTVLVLSILFVSFSSSNSQAQFRLKVGPQVGLNFNIGTGSDFDNTYTGFGALIGGQVDMNFTPVLGLIANMQFYDNRYCSYAEDHTTGNGIPYTMTNSLNLAYFMIEPLFKVSLPNSNFFFFIGPAIGFPVESTNELKLSGDVTFDNGTKKIKESMQDTNARFELKLGSGVDINLGGVYLTPQLSFGYGLTNIVENSEAKILTIQLMTTVKFNVL
ncbi:MAG: PorT family protein [Ignavibacteria bacterium]|jgi:hypothetical protein|nr:PorT family protein [Ignavibacteria bacterium]MCU7503627.1 PorT family protein [Ignavibacteria bacterium]MCU7517890.1 PorT family protein [Ignavibacteria bacterium]